MIRKSNQNPKNMNISSILQEILFSYLEYWLANIVDVSSRMMLLASTDLAVSSSKSSIPILETDELKLLERYVTETDGLPFIKNLFTKNIWQTFKPLPIHRVRYHSHIISSRYFFGGWWNHNSRHKYFSIKNRSQKTKTIFKL